MDTARLLDWYRRHRRSMPWREEVSPYRTMVSELMLQQTRVDTVIPYFHKFMEAFPTVEALAEAEEERVLERWAGLGYYRRARQLQAAAKAIVASGGFPSTAEGLRGLPGIGPYTAGAIASIALHLDEPVVDGNVERVLCRFDAKAEDPKKIAAQLWSRARALLPAGEAGDFNQALMELGATVCTPTSPRCLICPIREGCQGRGDPERYPKKPVKAATPEARACAVQLRRGDKILLARRPDTGLLAGLWEPPMGAQPNPAAVLSERLGLRLLRATPTHTVVHVFTHLRLTVEVWSGEAEGDPAPLPCPSAPAYQDARWFSAADLETAALSTLARKLLGPSTRSST